MPINPMALAGQADPFTEYARARREEPVSQLPVFGVWNVTRYEDCVSILRNPDAFSSNGAAYGPEMFARAGAEGDQPISMLTQDPPVHARLRGLVNRAFTPRMVAQLEPRIRAIAAELLDEAIARGGVDVIDDVAYPLPVIVIAEILGVPPEDRADFKRWSDALVAPLGAGIFSMGMVGEAREARDEFIAYFTRVFEQRRADPREDLVSNLLKLEAEGDHLSPDELMAMCVLLLVAGNETTTNLIGNAMLALAERPDVRDRVAADLSLVPSTVEEALRFYPAVQATIRFPKQEVVIGGRAIGARQPVVVWLASANRDEAVFPDPDTFDVTRDPNRHLTFGMGIHFCLGAPLARLEAKVALEEMLRRLPTFRRPDAAALERIQSFIFYGVKHLPLNFDTAVPVGER